MPKTGPFLYFLLFASPYFKIQLSGSVVEWKFLFVLSVVETANFKVLITEVQVRP